MLCIRLGAFSARVLFISFVLLSAGIAAPAPRPANSMQVPLLLGKQNQLLVRAKLNGKEAILALDTGAPVTCIDEFKAVVFGLKRFSGNRRVPGSITVNGKPHSTTMMRSLQIGEFDLQHTPAVLVDFTSNRQPLNGWKNKPPDGILGLDILSALGAVIDCRSRFMYLKTRPNGKTAFATDLRRAGWSETPVQLEQNHLIVSVTANGRATRCIVDTGSPVTVLDRTFCRANGLKLSGPRFSAEGIHFRDTATNVATVHIGIGGIAKRTSVAVFDLARLIDSAKAGGPEQISGLLGSQSLISHRAVIDCENLKLYLRR